MGRHQKSEFERQCDLIVEARTLVARLAADADPVLDGQYGWRVTNDVSPVEGLGPAFLTDLAALLDPLNPLAARMAERLLGPQ